MSNQLPDIEKTLKRILARELAKWPDDATFAFQDHDKELVFVMSNNQPSESGGFLSNLANDHVRQFARQAPARGVTRADWEAERAKILLESQPKRDPVIQEITTDASVAYQLERDYEAEEVKRYEQELWDKVAIIGLQDALSARLPREDLMRCVMNMADDFMAERAKRIAARKGSK